MVPMLIVFMLKVLMFVVLMPVVPRLATVLCHIRRVS